jgi:hypothetical protein
MGRLKTAADNPKAVNHAHDPNVYGCEKASSLLVEHSATESRH